jgi:ABC-type branched-subunit amino acid transport system ATPase component/branched-subunit amino acid ABC-type transport system permease component
MLSNFLPFVIIGVATGAVYGLAATGLVLTYKTSGIFNFAYGSLAALSIYVFFYLHNEHGWPWPLAAALCLFVLAPIEGLLFERLARALDRVGPDIQVVATVGILLVVLGVGALWYGGNTTIIPPFLPTKSVRVASVFIGWDQIILTILSITLTAVLYLLFRYVRIGIAMRGVVDNPSLLSLTGDSPVRVRRWSWLIGSVFSSLAGLLLAPALSLDPLIITMLFVQAFGAAAIGYFSNLPVTFIGGILLGVAGALTTKYVVQIPSLAGLPSSLPFAVLFIVLVVTPKARLLQRRVTVNRTVRSTYYAPARVRLGFGTIVVVLLALVPIVAGSYLSVWSSFLAEVILLLSVGLLVRTSGQISLCQLTFAAIGAATFCHLSSGLHVPWGIALLAAALISVPIGAVVSIPAIRLSGVFLALATLGFGIFVEQMFYNTHIMFGRLTNGIGAPRPQVSIGPWHLYTDRGFYYVILIILVGMAALSLSIQNGRLGRILRALSDSPLGLESYGTSTNVTKVVVFCTSAAMASVSGALMAMVFHFAIGSNYDAFSSLILVAVVVITVAGEPWYAVLGGLGLVVLPGYWNTPNVSYYLSIGAGVFAMLFALQVDHLPAVPQVVQGFLDKAGGRAPQARSGVVSSGAHAVTGGAVVTELRPAIVKASTEVGLRVSDLTVRYGGITAVAGVSLSVPMGGVTGLVGPNGAGKTTLFNACSGLIRPTAGVVTLHGQTVTDLSAPSRARRGLGRTFQKAQLFDSLTVQENIALGREAALAGANPLRQFAAGRAQRAVVSDAVADAVAAVGLGELLSVQAGLLPTGQKRLVELARVIAGGFDVLLLDEPSSGLDARETALFGEILVRTVDERGVAVLLVEHDMELVTRVCRDVFVLDFGSLIFEGPAAQMAHSEIVRTAYLGDHDSELDARAADAGLL